MTQTRKPPEWPKILNDAEWQKHKGVIAKIAGGTTGIGKELQETHKAFAQVKWSNPNLRQSAQLTEQAKRRLRLLAHSAKSQADTWQKNPVIPKATVAYLKQMAAAAADLADDIERFARRAR